MIERFDSEEEQREFEENLSLIRSRLEHESVKLPSSLRADALFERFSKELEEDSAGGESELPVEDTVQSLPDEEVSEDELSHRRKVHNWKAVAAIAACFVLVFAGHRLLTQKEVVSEDVTERSSDQGVTAQNMLSTQGGYAALYEVMLDLQKVRTVTTASSAGGAVVEEGADMTVPESGIFNMEMGDKRYSETNVQVSGIDESDIVKTDGNYLYQYRFDGETGSSEISIVNADKLEVVSTISLPWSSWAELYLSGDQMVVLQNTGEESCELVEAQLTQTIASLDGVELQKDGQTSEAVYGTMDTAGSFASYQVPVVMTEAVIYDISDHTSPREIRRFSQDGQYVSSRLKDNTLYLITNRRTYCDLNNAETPARQMLPAVLDGEEARLLDAEEIIIPPYLSNTNYSVVSAVDLTDHEIHTQAVLGSSSDVYMSSQNLYTVAEQYDGKNVYTGLVRFSLKGDGISYESSGAVPGMVDSQFSLHEQDGNLYVATTSYQDGKETNGLYILDEQFEAVGKLEGLAPGESIKAVRYYGDTAYVVTFEETDPLFVIDLSNPEKPIVSGELKIPGFSTYLHPIDEDTLVGIGINTELDPEGNVVEDGLKLSMFDVSDPKSPKEVDQLLIGNAGSYSEAVYNHKAFLYSSRDEMIGIPATVYEGNSNTRENSLALDGYLIISVSDNSFEVVKDLPNNLPDSNDYAHNNTRASVSRGVMIDQTLYTIASDVITAYSLDENFVKIDELFY